MKSGPKRVLATGAIVVGAAAVLAAFVLPNLRAQARDEIYAKLRDYEAAGEPLALLPENPPADPSAQRRFLVLLERSPFDPVAWEPRGGSDHDPYEFDQLVCERLTSEALTDDERTRVAPWIASLGPELAALRTLARESPGPAPDHQWTQLVGSLVDATRAWVAQAVLLAHGGDAPGALDALCASLDSTELFHTTPTLVSFLGWVFCGSITLEAAERVHVLLPQADYAPLVERLEARDTEARMARAYAGERVLYLESLGLLRDGEIQPESEFDPLRRSAWRPQTWTPAIERRILADLELLELLIQGGLDGTGLPPVPPSSEVQTILSMDVVTSANAHAVEVDRLRERLVETR